MGLVDEAEFHYFHFFPYTDLPADHKTRPSLWVDFPNSNYDPQIGSSAVQPISRPRCCWRTSSATTGSC